LSVDDGTVVRVATAQAGQRTARVVIELAGDAEFDVRAQGNRVQVRVPRLTPVVADATSPRTAEPSAVPQETPADRKAREQKSASWLRKKERPLRSRLHASAGSPRPKSRGRQAGQSREGRRRPEGPPDRRRRRGRRPKARGRGSQAKAATAKATEAKAKTPPPPRKLAMAGARHSITGIGFRPIGAGEVIVRSDHPLEYGVTGQGDSVLLHLPSAAFRSRTTGAPSTRDFSTDRSSAWCR